MSKEGEWAELGLALNHLLDIIDAYVRETKVSTQFASKGMYLPKNHVPRPSGQLPRCRR